jgi:multidrug resistance efflux pump
VNDGLCDQSIRADGTKVSAGQTLVSINNSDLKAKKAQADANILQATAGYNNARKITIVL